MRTIYSTRDISIPDGGKQAKKLEGNMKLGEHEGKKKMATALEMSTHHALPLILL
jgi:hypothetical protein